MVVKKKKTNQKKPVQKVQKVQKAVKKGVVKAKVSTKTAKTVKATQKAVKKTEKKTAPKVAQKMVKKTPEKNTKNTKSIKNAKTAKPVKAVKTVKPVPSSKKAVVKEAKKPEKSVKAAKSGAPLKVSTKKNVVEKKQPEKKTMEKPVVAKVQKPQSVLPVIKQPIEQSKKKMIQRNDDAMNEGMAAQSAPSTRKKATTLLGALEFMPYEPKADEAYMNDHQRDHFRKILDAWKQQLMQDVDLTVGHLKEEAVFYADPVDRAAQEEGFNLELRTRDRERKLIKKIEQSLDLLNTGEYGYCEDCGAEIGIRRLEARPTAVKCIDCKTFQEIREKQLGG